MDVRGGPVFVLMDRVEGGVIGPRLVRFAIGMLVGDAPLRMTMPHLEPRQASKEEEGDEQESQEVVWESPHAGQPA